jgi:hypothetical protein
MKTFFQWAEENSFEIPNLNEVEPETQPSTEPEAPKADTTENRARTGWSANYPPAYFSGQYPNKYVNPIKATADLDAENMKKKG